MSWAWQSLQASVSKVSESVLALPAFNLDELQKAEASSGGGTGTGRDDGDEDSGSGDDLDGGRGDGGARASVVALRPRQGRHKGCQHFKTRLPK